MGDEHLFPYWRLYFRVGEVVKGFGIKLSAVSFQPVGRSYPSVAALPKNHDVPYDGAP